MFYMRGIMSQVPKAARRSLLHGEHPPTASCLCVINGFGSQPDGRGRGRGAGMGDGGMRGPLRETAGGKVTTGASWTKGAVEARMWKERSRETGQERGKRGTKGERGERVDGGGERGKGTILKDEVRGKMGSRGGRALKPERSRGGATGYVGDENSGEVVRGEGIENIVKNIDRTVTTLEDGVFAAHGVDKRNFIENFQADDALKTITKLKQSGWNVGGLVDELITHLIDNNRFREAVHFVQLIVENEIAGIPPRTYTQVLKGFVEQYAAEESMVKAEQRFTTFVKLMYDKGYRTDVWQQDQVHRMASLLGKGDLASVGAGLPPDQAANVYRERRFDVPFALRGTDSRLRTLVSAMNEARQKNLYQKELVLDLINGLLDDGVDVSEKIIRLVIEHGVKSNAEVAEMDEIIEKVRYDKSHISYLSTRKLRVKKVIIEDLKTEKADAQRRLSLYLDTLIHIQECLNKNDVRGARVIADKVPDERCFQDCMRFIGLHSRFLTL